MAKAIALIFQRAGGKRKKEQVEYQILVQK